MYRDSFSEPGWMRFLRIFSASFRLGHFFRVEVRVFWLALIVMPIILLRSVEGLPFIEGATRIASITLSIYVVIWTHEMGHIWAGRRYGVETPLITLSPLGGLAHMSSTAPDPKKEIIISLAGPAVHLLWLAVFFPLSLIFDYGTFAPDGWQIDPVMSFVDTMVYINLWLTAFNLLPFFPLDGGHVFRAILAQRMHPNRASMIAAKVGTIGGITFIAVGIVLWITPPEDLWGIILILIGISGLQACKRERMAAQHSAGPYMTSDPLQPWQTDADAWKQGADDAAESVRKSEKRAERDAKRREREAEAERAFSAEVDRVLDRVNEVGMSGLSAKERKILDKASKRRRGE